MLPVCASLIRATLLVSPQQLGGDLELRGERVIFCLDLGVGEQTGLELFELDRHLMSFARREARVRRSLPEIIRAR
jgi:hypothetical protein